jgi:hypothetical protein
MFDNYSPKFESVFRIIFTIWASFWSVVNVFTLLGQYAIFFFNSGTTPDTELAFWWMNTVGNVISIAAGIILMIIMNHIPGRTSKNKPVGNIVLMTILAVVYYLMVTFIQIFSNAIFKPETFVRTFIFLSAWLLPSIILMIIHILYFSNLAKYNQEIEAKNTNSKS